MYDYFFEKRTYAETVFDYMNVLISVLYF